MPSEDGGTSGRSKTGSSPLPACCSPQRPPCKQASRPAAGVRSRSCPMRSTRTCSIQPRSYLRPVDLPPGQIFEYHGSLYGDWFSWESVRAVANDYPEATVVLIGDPPAARPSLPSNIHLLGLKPQQELPALPGAQRGGVDPVCGFGDHACREPAQGLRVSSNGSAGGGATTRHSSRTRRCCLRRGSGRGGAPCVGIAAPRSPKRRSPNTVGATAWPPCSALFASTSPKLANPSASSSAPPAATPPTIDV